ncbi:Hypothetical protein ERS075547_04231 [Mycobacteroides abscessus]|nr:Hypothetical protein ERS075547_04231 [Mycobacteroides abscessus]
MKRVWAAVVGGAMLAATQSGCATSPMLIASRGTSMVPFSGCARSIRFLTSRQCTYAPIDTTTASARHDAASACRTPAW